MANKFQVPRVIQGFATKTSATLSKDRRLVEASAKKLNLPYLEVHVSF